MRSMSDRGWQVESLAAAHHRIGLDSDVLIYLVDAVQPSAARAAAIIDAVEQGLMRASMSALAYGEILVGPARDGDSARFERTATELRDTAVDIVPVTAAIAEDAAWLRGRGAAHLIDAIHLATARLHATAFVTNDRRLRSAPGLEVYVLDDMELERSAP